MRIGIFTDSYPPFINGVSTSIVMLQKALEKQGHQVYVVTVNPKDMNYKFENDGKIIRIPGIPIGIYDYRLTSIYPFRVIKEIAKWNLDVIHSHTEFGVGTFARLIAKEFHIPLVHTYHTMYEDYIETITHGYFDKSSKKIVEYITKFYCDKTCNELIVPTKKTYDLFKNKYKYNREVYIIPTGIETERFYKENFKKQELNNLKKKLGFTETDFIMLYIGRIGKEKNIEMVIEIAKSLIKKHKDVKLLLVGDGPDLDYLKKLVSKYKIEKNVVFAGKVPYEETPKYYNISSIFITASHFETQGLTVIEAMSASVPTICIEDESFSDVVYGLNGYLFANKKEALNQIEGLIKDSKLLNHLGKGARKTAEMHSSKYYAEKVMYVYKKAIEKQKPSKREKFKNFLRRIGIWKKS